VSKGKDADNAVRAAIEIQRLVMEMNVTPGRASARAAGGHRREIPGVGDGRQHRVAKEA